jgi:hypothetical protein
MQRYTIFFITVNAPHVSGGFSAHHQELITVDTPSGICQDCLLLPIAVAASKLGIYSMLCVQFLSSWWWAEKPPEICGALTIIKELYNVASRWLYVQKHKITLPLTWNLDTETATCTEGSGHRRNLTFPWPYRSCRWSLNTWLSQEIPLDIFVISPVTRSRDQPVLSLQKFAVLIRYDLHD